MSIRLGQTLTQTLTLTLMLSLVVVAPLASGGCDMHRWAYIRISSVPPGATVRSKSLQGAHRFKATATPAGQFLPCTPIDRKAKVVVPQTHWSYVLTKPGYNDEELFVERSALAAHCADTKEEAREKPFTLRGKMMRITSEKGLRTAVKITSQPPGASIYDAGTKELLGKTPARVTFIFFAPYKVGRVLLFRLAGYQTLQRQVHVRSINLHVHMLRPGEKPRPVVPPKKRKAARNEKAAPPRRQRIRSSPNADQISPTDRYLWRVSEPSQPQHDRSGGIAHPDARAHCRRAIVLWVPECQNPTTMIHRTPPLALIPAQLGPIVP